MKRKTYEFRLRPDGLLYNAKFYGYDEIVKVFHWVRLYDLRCLY